ncbi:hypothetical protein VNO77_04800 [Canavalia gladiata]|uniref:HTH myb-type domain-containing protein n=1 Tax=Canavalia gladiata TaxID=3824 RepID=A0AAN9MX52_CANGL
MGSVPSELSLDLRPSFVPKTVTDFLYDLSSVPDKLPRLHDFLARLEDELRKIHAFKRELPLSMLLLNDAISLIKEESEKCRPRNSLPVLEEFIPLKKERDHHDENNNNDKECSRDKKNWMSSVQLWNTSSTNNNASSDHKQHHKLQAKKSEEEGQSVTEDPFQCCSNKNVGGGRGFMPFSTYACSSSSSVPVTTVALAAGTKEEKEESVVNRLSLLTPAVKSFKEGCGSRGSRSSSNRAVSSSPPTVQPSLRASPLQHQQQTARKQRRCWSPELHRRFVNALQKLGGSQAATPKQIRELMQVDGLTNDEVKSHLQKYRLHTRRVPAASGNQPVVVLGGLWMSQDHYNDSSKVSSSGSGSPQSPLHLTAGSRGGTSPTEGDSMEDDEDAKSESYSWKSHMHKPGKVDV